MRLDIKGSLQIALGANLALGPGAWTWTTVDSYPKASAGLHITQGRENGYSTVPPSTLTAEVDNAGGPWVARNAMGPWYGMIRKNIPIRFLADTDRWVPVAADTFNRTSTSGWGTADTGQSWDDNGSGGTVHFTDFTVSGGYGIQSVPVANGFRRDFIKPRTLLADMRVTATGTTCPVPTGGNLYPSNAVLRIVDASNYYLCRTQVTPTATVELVILRIVAGVTTTLAGPYQVPGMTHTATTPLNVSGECYGTTVRMLVWQGNGPEPVGAWQLSVVDPSPLDQPGFAGIRSGIATGNTNTLPVAFPYKTVTLCAPPDRLDGFIDELPVSWNSDPLRSRVNITASGIFRRLNQGSSTVTSAVTRHYTARGNYQPVAYWPMEEPSGSTLFSSGIGGPAMSYTDMSLGGNTTIPGSKALPTFGTNGAFSGKVPTYATPATPQWGVRFNAVIPSAPAADTVLFGWSSVNGLMWQVQVSAAGFIKVAAIATTGPGAASDISGMAAVSVAAYYGLPLVIRIDAVQSGTQINFGFYVAKIDNSAAGYTNAISIGGLTFTYTNGNISSVFAGPGLSGFTIGQVAVYDKYTAGNEDGSFSGWLGDTAAKRIARTAAGELLPVFTKDDTTGLATTLGVQPSTTLLGVLQDAADTDIGILHEAGYGVNYLSRFERYNRPVDLTLSYKAGHLSDLVATDDDQQTKNDVTVSRSGGSFARAMNSAHIATYGRYDDSVSINVEDDSQLPAQAQFRAGVGSVDDMRYPVVRLNFAKTPELLPAWKKCVVGSRIQIVDLPPDLPQDTVDLEIQGWSEDIDPGEDSWTVTINCMSAQPLQVFTIQGGGNRGRLASVQTLGTGVNATATSLSIATPTGSALWATGSMSVDVGMAGERMTVTFVSGTSSPQTATVVRSVNKVVKSQVAGAAISLWRGSGVAL